GDQHALSEEPLPDAHQEHLAESLLAQLVFHHGARPDGGNVLPVVGAHVAEGLLAAGPEPAARAGETAPDSGRPPGGRRIHGELVPGKAGEQAGAEEKWAHCVAFRNRQDVRYREETSWPL